jgi:transcriptional regulator with XRE-family HTH domain
MIRTAKADGAQASAVAVGSAVRAIRKRIELNQVPFADLLAIRQGPLSSLENGKFFPSTELLIKILRLAHTDKERSPLLAALAKRGVMPSDLALKISASLAVTPSSIDPTSIEGNSQSSGRAPLTGCPATSPGFEGSGKPLSDGLPTEAGA